MRWLPIRSIFRKIRMRWRDFSVSGAVFSPDDLSLWQEFYLMEESDMADEGTLSASNLSFFSIFMSSPAPDVGNPWPQGCDEHYAIHPCGFIATEVARIVSVPQTPVEEIKRENAKIRLGVLLRSECKFVSIQGAFPRDDIEFAFMEALADGRWEEWGGDDPTVLSNAVRHRLIPPLAAPGLILSRILLEESRHPSPWRRLVDCVSEWRYKASRGKPPKVDLAAFRERRRLVLEPAATAVAEEKTITGTSSPGAMDVASDDACRSAGTVGSDAPGFRTGS